MGLSPRVRGSHKVDELPRRKGRSIPTCAGQPPDPIRRGRLPWVYPHLCGAAALADAKAAIDTGLSPRVRGSPIHYH